MNDRRPEVDSETARVTVVPTPGQEMEARTTRVAVAPAVPVANQEPTLGELVMGLTDDITTLVRKEVELAKTELQENIKEGAAAGGMIAAGGMVAYAGLILVLIAIAIALGQWWDNLWLATLVVGIVTLLLGWAIFNGGKNQLKDVSLVPRKTISSVNRDAKVVKEKLS
jgi:uncharacterized membrane protein YqjE